MVEYSYICDKEDNMKRNLEWHDENGKATPLYRKWAGARKRCYNKHDRRYPLYGGRGIRMCDEWLMSFRTFAEWAYGHGYRTGLSLDRIDNDGNYCPENCRFVTMDEQKRNRRPSRDVQRSRVQDPPGSRRPHRHKAEYAHEAAVKGMADGACAVHAQVQGPCSKGV